MKKLIIYYGDSPVYVEGFPKDCPRSCEGAVHVLPRKPVTVTDQEYEHILAKYSWMKPKLKMVARTVPDVKKAEKESSEVKTKEPSKKSLASETAEETEKKEPSKDGVKPKGAHKKKTRTMRRS